MVFPKTTTTKAIIIAAIKLLASSIGSAEAFHSNNHHPYKMEQSHPLAFQDSSSPMFYTDQAALNNLPHFIQHIPHPPRFAPPMHLLLKMEENTNTETKSKFEWEEVSRGEFMPLGDASLSTSERQIQAYMNYMIRP